MNRCHISRFVRFFRGRAIVRRKVSVFDEASWQHLALCERIFGQKSEGSLLWVVADSEVRERNRPISSL